MKLFDKLKDKINDFIYEDEPKEEKPKEEDFKIKDEVKEEKEQDEDSILTVRDLFKTDPKFSFPIDFGDDDFVEEDNKEVEKEKPKEPEETSRSRLVEKRTVIEEKKVFRPSPAISPVYGILDKNYKKEDIKEKGSQSGIGIDGKIDVDTVMKKAYGQVEVTKTITREEKFYTTEEEPIESETEINLFESLKEEEITEKPLSRIELNESEYEEESYDIDEIDDKIKSIDKLLKETSEDANEDDFYSLVDSMYKDEEDTE